MIREEQLYELLGVLEKRGTDVRAEVLLNHLRENGLINEGFVVSHNGFFYREFTKDIYGASVAEDKWYRQYLEIELSRSGFYDMLPEALFHQPDTSEFRQRSGVSEMITRYKKNTVKEKEARKFFQPFENAFFHQQMELEREELDLLDTLRNKTLSLYFLKFWGLPTSFSVHEVASFLLLFPYAHIINGNIPLMESCLRVLLKEEVAIIQKQPVPTLAEGDWDMGLGSQPLGDYMICGNEFMEEYPNLSYRIGPLKNSRVIDYIEAGRKEVLIRTFNNFFAPVEADIEIDIAIDSKTQGMSFAENDEIILGYSSVM